MNRTTKQMLSGQGVDLAAPDPRTIRLSDIALNLSRIWCMDLPDVEGQPVVVPLPSNTAGHVFETRVRILVREAGNSPLQDVMSW